MQPGAAGEVRLLLLAESWRQSSEHALLQELCELAAALSFSVERHLETIAQGSAFVSAATLWVEVSDLPKDVPLPVAVGFVSGQSKVALEATLAAYLHAYVSNQVQAALRLIKLGQAGGVSVLAALEGKITECAQKAAASTLDDLGSSTLIADCLAMQHETMESRIFRS